MTRELSSAQTTQSISTTVEQPSKPSDIVRNN